MPEKSTTGRKAGSPLRRLRTVERLLVVGAVAAVLVAVGAWIAMNRPGAGAEAAGAESSVGASVGSSTTDGGTGSVELPAPTADGFSAAESTAAASGDAGSGDSASGSAGSGSAGSGDSASGGGATGSTGSSTGSSSSGSGPISPTKSFLTALTESGLAPPVDDAQKLAMADDVCQELGYGSKYADVVRALTFAGASDAEAANFATLAITNICPQYKAG